MKVRLAPAAEADLAHIRDTVLSANPPAAEQCNGLLHEPSSF